MYIHERKDWPEFSWNQSALTGRLAEVRHAQGRLLGRMEALGFPLREEATLQTLTQDVLKTSEIEGEKLDAGQVRSSLARRMGLDIGALPAIDRNVEGIVEVMLDATRQHDEPLTTERLFGWHAALFPTGRTGMRRIAVGGWRTEKSGPMQVVSGPIGHEKVHYEAPEADRLKKEMARFLNWCNTTPTVDPVIQSALAHFWFVTIHPFEDGNGRIGRALAEKALEQALGQPALTGLATTILSRRKEYYNTLEDANKGNEISAWLAWFAAVALEAQKRTNAQIEFLIAKTKLMDRLRGHINARQQKALLRMLREGPEGFEGGMSAGNYSTITGASPATATRDLAALVEAGALHRTGELRHARYFLRLAP